MVQIFIADLNEDAAAGREQVAGQQQPVTQIRQVGMQAQIPMYPDTPVSFQARGLCLRHRCG